MWYKGDPAGTIPAGGVAQVVIRLRYLPTTPTVAVGVVGVGNTVTTNITVDASAPQLASVSFSTNMTQVYLHWRRRRRSGAGDGVDGRHERDGEHDDGGRPDDGFRRISHSTGGAAFGDVVSRVSRGLCRREDGDGRGCGRG